MLHSAQFHDIPGFSKIYTDFFTKDSAAWQRFPANHDPRKTFEKRLSGFKNREAMQPIFDVTMHNLDLSPGQQRNLELLKKENTLVVITGQQVGLFGGALYTFFKAQSAVVQAQKFSEQFPECCFVPVFWVEDNDHDRAEAEHTAVLTSTSEILSLKAPGDLQHKPHASIGEIRLPDDVGNFLDELITQLPVSPYSAESAALLKEIYTPGKLWSDAYLELLHHIFKNSGLLFVKGSEVRKSGLSRDILLKELSHPGASRSVAEKAGAELLKAGYHVQAAPSDVHLFLHDGVERFKINTSEGGGFSIENKKYSREELLKIAEDSPERFSPNVLLRPIVQDVVFPTAAYIAGPGELSYAAELHEMYEHFGVRMPMFVPRHSATFVEYKAEKFLLKEEMQPQDFFKKWPDVERDFAEKVSDENITALFKKNQAALEDFFKNIHQSALEIDKSLDGAVKASKTLTEKHIMRLFKKVTAAQKRRNPQLFKKYHETWAMLFPNGGLQERTFSVVHYLFSYGEESVGAALEEFFDCEPTAHFFIFLKKYAQFPTEKSVIVNEN